MIIKNYKKHNSVPTNEWSESRYSFNKKKERSLLLKKNVANRIIKGYFNLTHKEKTFKSRRMRNLIKRSSVIRLFNSKGMMKHNNNTVNINLYTFDKNKSSVLKNLYKFNKSLSKLKRYNVSILKKIHQTNNPFHSLNRYKKNTPSITNGKQTKLNRGVMSNFRLIKNINVRYNKIYMANMYYYYNTDFNKKSVKIYKLSQNKTNNNSNSKNQKNLLKRTFNKFTKIAEKLKQKHLRSKKKLLFRSKRKMLRNKRKLLYSNLIKALPWSLKRNRIILYKIMVLRLFYMSIINNMNIKLHIDTNNNCIIVKQKHKETTEIKNVFDEIKISLPSKYNLININNNLKELKREIANVKKNTKEKNIKSKLVNSKKLEIKNYKLINKMKVLKWQRTIYINRKIEGITNILLNKLSNNSIYEPLGKHKNIYDLKRIMYNEFKKHNLNKIFKRYFLKQYVMIRNIYGSYINNEKLVSLTKNLKYLLNLIYNKKINLNITNLKYLHLNSDMLSDGLVVKLRNKNNNLRRMIGRTLKLIKLGKLNSNIKINNEINNIKTVNFSNLMNDMYNLSNSNNLINDNNNKNNLKIRYKIKETFKNLRHKWITGARLEGKGRLTSRYTAARSLYKYRAKGNLKSKFEYYNKDYLTILKEGRKISKKNPSVTLYRGISTPNLQYVKKSGFRRIGAFGIKLWVNNNS